MNQVLKPLASEKLARRYVVKQAPCPACGTLSNLDDRGQIYCRPCNRPFTAGEPVRTIACPDCGTEKLSTSRTMARCLVCNRTWWIRAKSRQGRRV